MILYMVIMIHYEDYFRSIEVGLLKLRSLISPEAKLSILQKVPVRLF